MSNKTNNHAYIKACADACKGFSIEELEGADLFKDSIKSYAVIREMMDCLDYAIFAQPELEHKFKQTLDKAEKLLVS